MEKNKNSMIKDNGLLKDIEAVMENSPVSQLKEEQQRWLGVLYTYDYLKTVLSERPQSVSEMKRHEMQRFCRNVEWLKRSFDLLFQETLRRECGNNVAKN